MIYKYTKTPKTPAAKIVEVIKNQLKQNKKVLWLISGGSVIDVAVEASKQLENQSLLTIMQIDERFGPEGHTNSNWQQLINKGFNVDAFACHPILMGKDIEQTTSEYGELLSGALKSKDFVIGLFGIGVDGHTAGILPSSVAANEQHHLVVHYQTPGFNRITVTPPIFAQLDVAVVFALGEAKASVLALLRQDLLVIDQPAQALKQAKELYVYTDNKGVM